MDEPWIFGRSIDKEVDEIFSLFGIYRLEDNWKDGIIFELIFYSTCWDN